MYVPPHVMRGRKLVLLSFVCCIMYLGCCDEDGVHLCPCLDSKYQQPLYKGCDEPRISLQRAHDCSSSSILLQVYSVLEYPEEAKTDSIEGRIVISFEIGVDGHMYNFQVVNDSLGYGLADAVIQAAQTLDDPGFCPALENCIPLPSTFYLPVSFQLPP